MRQAYLQLSNNFKGIILAIIGFTAFAIADAAAKYLTLFYDPFLVTGTVAVFTSSLCLALSPFLGGLRKTLKTKKLKYHLIRGMFNVVTSLMIVFSFSKLTLAGTYSMVFVTPFVVLLLAIPIFKEHVNKHGWIAIIVGFIGVLVVVRPGMADINPWLFLPLVGTLFISGLFLSARKLDDEETLISLAFYPTWSNLLLITPVVFYLFGFESFAHAPLFFICALGVVTGLTCTALAFRIAKAALVAPFIYSEMIWAVGFDYFLFKEPPDMWTLIGAGIIIASGIYLIETERRA